MKYNLMFAQFPHGASTHPDVGDWLLQTALKVKADPRVGESFAMRVDDTPITMSRNRVLKACLDLKVDYCVMIDSDAKPDAYLASNPNKISVDPRAKPFWETSWDFALAHEGPCVIASPYCGPPPHENIYVFQWANFQSDQPNVDFRLEQFTREEAARWAGIVEVGALPTGLILIDMRCLNAIKPPWFEYEWEDPPFNTKKATTEDVFFTRNLSLAGVPQYVNWDAWSGHHKRKCVGKPSLLAVENVRESFRESIMRGDKQDERKVYVRTPKPKAPRFAGDFSDELFGTDAVILGGHAQANGDGPKQPAAKE